MRSKAVELHLEKEVQAYGYSEDDESCTLVTSGSESDSEEEDPEDSDEDSEDPEERDSEDPEEDPDGVIELLSSDEEEDAAVDGNPAKRMLTAVDWGQAEGQADDEAAAPTSAMAGDGEEPLGLQTTVERGEQQQLLVGIDIGRRNLGVGIVDPTVRPEGKRVMLFNVDMYIARDKAGEWRDVMWEQTTVYPLVLRLLDDFDEYFRQARCIGIETQPMWAPGGSETEMVKLKLIACCILVTASHRYPNCRVMYVNPKFTRRKLELVFGGKMVGNGGDYQKKAKVCEFMRYAEKVGTLEPKP